MAVIAREQRRGARLRALSWNAAIIPLAIACVTLATLFAADELYAERALPGLTIGRVSVGSLDRAALHQRLQSELAGPWASATVTATLEDRTWTATNADLGVAPDVDGATAAAISFGKTGSIIDRANAWMDALRGEGRVPFALRARGDGLERWIGVLTSAAERPAVAGDLAVTPRGLTATEPVIGRALDRTATTAAILAADSLGDRTVALRVRPVYPSVDDSGFRAAYERARAVVTPLVVTVEDGSMTEDPAGLSGLLSIERAAVRAGELPVVPADAIAPSARYRFIVTVNEKRLAEWASALATKLDRPAKSAKYVATREGVLTVVPGATGIKLEPRATVAFLASELLEPAGDTRTLAVPAAIDVPAFTTEQAKEWAAKLTRTSTYSTNFPKNASRHANIATGASQFDGVVVAPGATFSFWELLGPVSVARGYTFAGAIVNNRSDESVIGGGLCQVSTTMFNALASQGYEIVERHAHGYLIERYPLGLDAAVFDPGYDFRWRNDTAAPVFLWSWVSDTSVTFDVWSIPTGREVSFSDAAQRNFVDVAPNQPADPAFAAGYKVLGRDVFRTRTVLQGGKVLHQDTFTSHYVPAWGGPAPLPAP